MKLELKKGRYSKIHSYKSNFHKTHWMKSFFQKVSHINLSTNILSIGTYHILIIGAETRLSIHPPDSNFRLSPANEIKCLIEQVSRFEDLINNHRGNT